MENSVYDISILTVQKSGKQSFNAIYYNIIMKLDKTNARFSLKAPLFSQRYQIYCRSQSSGIIIKN